MRHNPLIQLESLGQSIWLDFIRREFIKSGDLKKLIDEDGLSGVTSNPSIFQKSIAENNDYDHDIQRMTSSGKSIQDMYDTITQDDVRSAAGLFHDLYKKTQGKDGYVSLEVNPHLAHDTKGTVKEAQNLWKALDRPNVLIKVPATKEGLPAIQQLISEGINVNVTLLFGLDRYRKVAQAYISGLEERLAQKQPLHSIASVASFFLSRIDVMLDPQLEKPEGKTIHGKVAIASAKMAYQIYLELFESERFKKLMQHGARPQRLLWASTSTKNPDYSDVRYVDALIGPETVNTLPPETLEAYRDHGDPHNLLTQDIEQSKKVFTTLESLGINIDEITQKLETEGVEKFNESFDELMDALKKKSGNSKK